MRAKAAGQDGSRKLCGSTGGTNARSSKPVTCARGRFAFGTTGAFANASCSKRTMLSSRRRSTRSTRSRTEDIDVALLLYPRIGLGRTAFDSFRGPHPRCRRVPPVARPGPLRLRRLPPRRRLPTFERARAPHPVPDGARPIRRFSFFAAASSTGYEVRPRRARSSSTLACSRRFSAPVPSLRERIASANLATTLRIGVDTLAQPLRRDHSRREETQQSDTERL
jgi:hypothetical protein